MTGWGSLDRISIIVKIQAPKGVRKTKTNDLMTEGLDSIQFHNEILIMPVSILRRGQGCRGNLTTSRKVLKVHEIDN